MVSQIFKLLLLEMSSFASILNVKTVVSLRFETGFLSMVYSTG